MLKHSVGRQAYRLAGPAIVCGLDLALPACHIPGPRQAEPAPALPVNFNGVTTPGNSAQLRVEDFFNDPVLTQLIQTALAGNQELKILAQDVQIANNEVLLRRGALFPFVTVRADAGLDKSSRFTRDGAVDRQLGILPGRRIPDPLPNFLVAANFNWQTDIWRKLRNARDAAALRFLATAEGRNYVVTRLVAQVAENYYGLLALDQRLETLDNNIAIQERSLEIARARFAAARGNEVAVQRFQAEVRRNQSEKLVVRQEIVEVENRINFLVGRFPQPVERPSGGFLELNLRALSVGVPSQLLLNRPDIREAERELEAAGLEVKVARAEFFPSLDITGSVGFEAFNPRYLFNPEAFFANVAGGLVAPLVNRTAIQVVYGTANARQLQAVYNYQRVVLDAFAEVVNRVSAAENYRTSIELKRQQLDALGAAIDAANKLFQAARVEYLEVLTAQRELLEARTTLIDIKRQQLSAVVNAYQALGGGGYLSPLFDPKSCPAGAQTVTAMPDLSPSVQPSQPPKAVSAPGGQPLPTPRPLLAPPGQSTPAKVPVQP